MIELCNYFSGTGANPYSVACSLTYIYRNLLNLKPKLTLKKAASEFKISKMSVYRFKKENEELLEVLGLMFEGELYSSDKYKEFANLPTKEESLAKMGMMLNQPMTKLVSTLNGALGTFVGVLNSLKDTKS